MSTEQQPKSIIVIFGATGDLARRKLYPSIFNLYQKHNITEDFAVIGVARREWSDDYFRSNVRESVLEYTDTSLREEVDQFSSHFYYHPFDVTDKTSYNELNELLSKLDKQYHTAGNRMFYMAMAPQFFGTIALNLQSEGLTQTQGWKRLLIEKPFGHDLPSAEKLNNQIREAFSEDEIYRIDHYLGKEMVQNIEVIRFANAIFEPLWNNRFISNVQITSSETVGVGERVGYYERYGAIRDMVQNHILQMVSLLAMEPPVRLVTEEIRNEKVKVLRSLRPVPVEEADDYFVRGQYDAGFINEEAVEGYVDENRVEQGSNTDTFVSGKLLIDNFRWAGVPFYIRTGKRMPVKSTKIVVQFKDIPMDLYFKQEKKSVPNVLVIHIQPDEGVTLHLNAKEPGHSGETTPIQLAYHHGAQDGINTREAYEGLLNDCMRGDATNFARWDEVALSWDFIDPIVTAWAQKSHSELPKYEAGTMGPKESDALLDKDGFVWWPIAGE